MWWGAIESRTSDATPKGPMDRTLPGMEQAADQKDPNLMNFAADIALMLAGGLETFLTAHPHIALSRPLGQERDGIYRSYQRVP